MKIFIVDDNSSIIKILEKIIYDKELGEVVGRSCNGYDAIKDIDDLMPDIVLLDLLMPDMDGIELVKEIKSRHPQIQCIMISQVSSKEMISKAYENGIEFFISKPINAVEVKSVIGNVASKIDMNKKLEMIQGIFSSQENKTSIQHVYNDSSFGIKRVLQRLGILSESGSQDIISVVEYLLNNNKSLSDMTIIDLCSKFTDNPKVMEQRMRRAATTGMKNLANIGLEDYMNEIFTEYANALYNFEQIKLEMDFLRDKNDKRGKINLKKFIEGIVYFSEIEMSNI